MHMTVLMNAGPWLPVPPAGYGGIENVVATLVPELRRRGVRVVLCAAPGSTLEADRVVTPLADAHFGDLAAPYGQACGVAHAHMAAVLAELRADERVDVVHDHLEVVGPSLLAALGGGVPALQTLHWDLRKHPEFYAAFDGQGRVWFNGVSHRQIQRAPERLRRQILGVVPLAVDVAAFPFTPHKGERCLSLARISPLKGTDLAARVCRAAGVPLDIAGPVGPASGPDELQDDLRHPDAAYFRDRVAPLLDGDDVRWVGSLTGQAKLDALAAARALVFPVQWEEPGATAVVEALACGTPVIGTRRGVLPTLVDHGRTGFLADTEEELAGYVRRAHEIDPAECRRVAEERLSSGVMADRYLELYAEVKLRSGASPARPAARGGGAPRWTSAAPVPRRAAARR